MLNLDVVAALAEESNVRRILRHIPSASPVVNQYRAVKTFQQDRHTFVGFQLDSFAVICL